jgi:hypothetical protein
MSTARDDFLGNLDLHFLSRIWFLAIDASGSCKASMRLHDLTFGDASHSFESVDILSKMSMEESFVREQLDKCVSHGGPEPARSDLMGKCVNLKV